jgi:hypothetical protein
METNYSWTNSIGMSLIDECRLIIDDYTLLHIVKVDGINVDIGDYDGELSEREKNNRIKQKYNVACIFEELHNCKNKKANDIINEFTQMNEKIKGIGCDKYLLSLEELSNSKNDEQNNLLDEYYKYINKKIEKIEDNKYME